MAKDINGPISKFGGKGVRGTYNIVVEFGVKIDFSFRGRAPGNKGAFFVERTKSAHLLL